MSQSNVVEVALGAKPDALTPDVVFATPFTLTEICGVAEVTRKLSELVKAFGVEEAEFVFDTPAKSVVTFRSEFNGHVDGLLVFLTKVSDGRYSRVDAYARPFPYSSLVRNELAKIDGSIETDIDLREPYQANGPGEYLDAGPAFPPYAADVTFRSPVLTATAQGAELVGRVFDVVNQVMGEAWWRAAIPGSDGASMLAAYDGTVDGHTWQIAAVLSFNKSSELQDVLIFSRPWPVTAIFRAQAYKLLKDDLGPEFWQGPPPLDALGEGV